MPKVSVIIPTYNRAKFLKRAINSVLNQTFKDFELIIVDDGSTDDTSEVIYNFGDSRIKYIRYEKNKGAAVVRNTGIKNAKGDFIAFQDSDDEWLSQKLKKQMEIFENLPLDIGIVYTDKLLIKDQEKIYGVSPHIMPSDGIIYNQALNYGVMNIGIGTALIRKECFDRVGMFDEALPRFIDLEFFIRLSKHYRFYHINEPFINYYQTPFNITSNLKKLIEARKIILNKYLTDIKKNKFIWFHHLYMIGALLCLSNEKDQGRKYFLKAFKIYPWSLKLFLTTFFSFLGNKVYRKVIFQGSFLKEKFYSKNSSKFDSRINF